MREFLQCLAERESAAQAEADRLRVRVGRAEDPSAVVLDTETVQPPSTPPPLLVRDGPRTARHTVLDAVVSKFRCSLRTGALLSGK